MVTVADAKVEPKHYVTVKSDLDMIQLPPNPPVLFSARASSPSPSPSKRERERAKVKAKRVKTVRGMTNRREGQGKEKP